MVQNSQLKQQHKKPQQQQQKHTHAKTNLNFGVLFIFFPHVHFSSYINA
jgi:hypothetical protein